LREVTGLALEASGHVMLDKGAGVRSTQRLALGDVGGGIVVFTWPAELQQQAKYLYEGDRGNRLLAAVNQDGWDVEARPHLAFWLSSPEERLYLNPTIGPDEYVAQWSGPDFSRIGQHDADSIRPGLWPWLLERGYASEQDETELGLFITRLKQRKRPAHLRPGLRLKREWSAEAVTVLRERGKLVDEIRASVNRILAAVGDPQLRA
jgi:hypothetical protein